MMQEWISKDENQTIEIVKTIANDLSYPAIICLNGQLGAGKSVFSRAFIRHILNDETLTIPSPTYTLVQTYDDEAIWHFDLYRLEHADQLYDIGWEEALCAKICLIEWPERLAKLWPKKTVNITIDVLQDGQRRITLDA